MSTLSDENTRVKALRDKLENGLMKTVPRTSRNGSKTHRLPNTSNLSFDRTEAGAILKQFDHLGLCASSGSACTTGSISPSHVLTAMGLNSARAKGSIRFSLGIYNTEEEVDYVLKHVPPVIQHLRD